MSNRWNILPTKRWAEVDRKKVEAVAWYFNSPQFYLWLNFKFGKVSSIGWVSGMRKTHIKSSIILVFQHLKNKKYELEPDARIIRSLAAVILLQVCFCRLHPSSSFIVPSQHFSSEYKSTLLLIILYQVYHIFINTIFIHTINISSSHRKI